MHKFACQQQFCAFNTDVLGRFNLLEVTNDLFVL